MEITRERKRTPMKKFISILAALLMVACIGAVGASAESPFAGTVDSVRYALANAALGDSSYVIVQSPAHAEATAQQKEPDINWHFVSMRRENGGYIDTLQGTDAEGVVHTMQIDAITGEVLS